MFAPYKCDIELVLFEKNSLEFIKRFDFSTVDKDSLLYFSEMIIENHNTVTEYLENYQNSVHPKNTLLHKYPQGTPQWVFVEFFFIVL